MKCEVEDCIEDATAIVNDRLQLCDGHLYDYLESPLSRTSSPPIFRFFDRRRMAAFEKLQHMDELPKGKILEVIKEIMRSSPERYPPTRHFLFETGRKVEGFPGSQDSLKRYLDRLVEERHLIKTTEPYRNSSKVPYQSKYALAEDWKGNNKR